MVTQAPGFSMVTGMDALKLWNQCASCTEASPDLHAGLQSGVSSALSNAEWVSTGRYRDSATLRHWLITANLLFFKTLRQSVRRLAVGPGLRGGITRKAPGHSGRSIY